MPPQAAHGGLGPCPGELLCGAVGRSPPFTAAEPARSATQAGHHDMLQYQPLQRSTDDAQFSLTEEKWAFPVDPQQGEFLYKTIYTDPVPEVVAVLQGFTSLPALWPYLPAPFAEDGGASRAQAGPR